MNAPTFLALFINYSTAAVLVERVNFTMSVKEGKTLTLPCILPSEGFQNSTVSWYFNGEQISESENITDRGNDSDRYSIYRPHDSDWFLKVSPTRTSDAGIYVCTADNSTIVTGKLVIEYAASITGYQSRDVYLRVCEGTTRVKMWCNVTGVPKPTIRWYFLKEPNAERANIGLSNEMVFIPKVERTSQGMYRCEVSNMHGNDVLTYHIAVIEQITRFDNGWTDKGHGIPNLMRKGYGPNPAPVSLGAGQRLGPRNFLLFIVIGMYL
ncbi:contactin-5-like isoform X2 [Mya arenaria]|uniref:contactin-5-like isoform X2 n=1 Tax=Mya arenaria TaxID=6604 RepID=UPI0022E62B6C|nr:contactin-5-like isoform X2 [Mya arenaria]